MDGEILRGPCAECGEQITTQATECNHCGHNPGREQYHGPAICILLGGLLSILIITAIIGIPLTIVGVVWSVVVWYRSDDPGPIDDDWLAANADVDAV